VVRSTATVHRSCCCGEKHSNGTSILACRAAPATAAGQRCRMATRPRSPDAQQEPSGVQLTVSNWPVSNVCQVSPPLYETSEPVSPTAMTVARVRGTQVTPERYPAGPDSGENHGRPKKESAATLADAVGALKSPP